jgi:hypothetical protein
MSRNVTLSIAVLGLLLLSAAPPPAEAQRGRARRQPRPAVCGDPTVACGTFATFEPYDLPFRVSQQTVIWESEPFYAVILKSVRNRDCRVFVPEAERLRAQADFPRHKVFTSRCAEPVAVYYTGLAVDARMMAVYAGRTRAEAAGVLAKVKATGKYPGAYLRRMSIGFNGT